MILLPISQKWYVIQKLTISLTTYSVIILVFVVLLVKLFDIVIFTITMMFMVMIIVEQNFQYRPIPNIAVQSCQSFVLQKSCTIQ